MLRKMMIALAATTFMGALAASTAADARQSVCVRPVQSVPQSPLCLRGGAIWRRRWSLWRLVLELATDPVGLAAGLDL